MRRSLSVLAPFLGLMLFLTGAAIAAEDFQEISHEDLKKAIADKSVTLLDLNGTESFQKKHIPGAVDFKAKKDELKSLLPEKKEALIVAYCGSPKCGAWKEGATAAAALGYTNIKHYKPGISGWSQKEATPAKE